ncbi:uncharacterized protein G2W53_038113 [Senna tora]|uniref:Uncharacterized protein n=1 Tax=Senna tora TaxID=362788 RepID=A0A834SRB2_9FABA|nr:uncharacterized protein G2W53_038113 [Senna tora]
MEASGKTGRLGFFCNDAFAPRPRS